MERLFTNPSHRVFALYGNTGDFFYTPRLRELDINLWLLTHFKTLGYERVVFYAPDQKIHFADIDSAKLARPQTEESKGRANSNAAAAGASSGSDRNGNPQPEGEGEKRPSRQIPKLKGGPLGMSRMSRAAAPAAPTSAPVSQENIRWNFGAMSDADAIHALDRMMQENLSTVLIFRNGEDLFSLLDGDAIRHWDNIFGGWTGASLAPGSRNMALLVFQGDVELNRQRMPRLSSHLFKGEDTRPKPELSFHVGPGRMDEVAFLLHRLRLQGRLLWTSHEVETQSPRLARELIPDNLDQGVKGMNTLCHEILSSPQCFREDLTDPWEELRSRTGMKERVEIKLQGLVKRAKEKLARHAPPAKAPLGHDVQRLIRETAPSSDKLENLHLALMGSPGTGKTTTARIIAQIYRKEGLLASGHRVEVSSKDLIEEHIGGTARRTAEAVSRAMGGVLFIDEAYSLNLNSFGQEAIAELVQSMTTFNGQFSLIVAGYTREMTDFIEGPEANPGLARRFPSANRWVLENYTGPELFEIFRSVVKSENLSLDAELEEKLPFAFEQWIKNQDRDRFGNAGEVINLVAGLKSHAGSLPVLKLHDFRSLPGWRQWLGLQQLPSVEELLKPLDALVGLQSVRSALKKLCHSLHAEMLRNGSLAGFAPGHYLFVGNSGTGKTEVALKMGALFYELGLLNRNHVERLNASDVVGSYAGTAENTIREALRRAQDGVLFIDEAHQLVSAQGQDALKVLVPEMENRRNQLCVILAGYPADMQALLNTDSGLASRTQSIPFEDYTGHELHQICQIMLSQRKMRLSDEGSEHLLRLLAFLAAQRDRQFGNARTVRELLDREILPHQSERILSMGLKSGDPALFIIEKEDLPSRPGFDPKHWEDAVKGAASTDVGRLLEELQGLVGLSSVKNTLVRICDTLAVQQRRGRGELLAGHYVFSGNPGTGKTTVARLMGRIFRSLGLLSRGHVVEVKREDLVGRYQGDAENNTKERIEEALDGILFVDEAYQLVQDEHDSYGKRALETLLANMDNYRHRLCVILAGYPEKMQTLLQTNPGFKRRIPETIVFPDYSGPELCEIAQGMFRDQGYTLSAAAAMALERHLAGWDERRGRSDFGNAGDVRNLVAAVIARQSSRLRPLLDEVSEEMLNTLEAGDIGG